MPPVFNIVRVVVYVAVLLWTVVCLAIAAHFQSILLASDLTRFVPFAIFVCATTMLIIVALLAFGLMKERNPISTRIELGCLGLTGVLWLALSAFVASSDSEMADVECFSSSDANAQPIDIPGFNTEMYQAQYHVLEAFSFFNMILRSPKVLGFFVLLLVLALRQQRMGTKHVWIMPVAAIAWFGRTDKPSGKLPAPVTHRSRSVSRRPRAEESEKEKPSRTRSRSRSRPADVRRNESQRGLIRDASYRTTDSRTLGREDSYSRPLAREDSYSRTLGRDDSRKTNDSRRALLRDDSRRTTDSRRRDVSRDDSRRTADSSRRRGRDRDLSRDASRRTNDSSSRAPSRENSRRAPIYESHRTKTSTDLRRQNTTPSRNEEGTYVFETPFHRSPQEAHTRETRTPATGVQTRAPARDIAPRR
ncbi:uncharacterized protein BXZ73DRAFT_74369 [Epithele typhae]|uniref:uncharacterized protein n=1 Tax=Epithele typhae TaxID=378194 RepID=UPI0020083B8B|nr:uncharacterized protein BXZ73DRAFT_74369 [Epithele typhae]KAH9943406.1 hypothetical protein BXZ73DRAFT_74369 [Epithele typhae]